MHRGPDRARKLVIVPDAHASPAYPNDRFVWLGRFLARERPDVVVCLGDFADLPSLSAYDRGKRGFEGRRYTKDVEVTRDALEKLHGAMGYTPELILTLGNHEARVDRAANDNAELEGTLSIDDLGYREHGWQVVPYQSTAMVAGFAISHHFASGVAGRPIGGMTAAAQMTRLLYTSAIVGHSHVIDFARRTRPDGSHLLALVAGCYVAPEHHEGWSAASEHLWWRGVVVLEDAHDGDAGEIRWVTQERMKLDAQSAAPLARGGAASPVCRDQLPTFPTPSQVDTPARYNTGTCSTQRDTVDVGGLDYDDAEHTHVEQREPRPGATFAEVARLYGRDESTVRKKCHQDGIEAWQYRPAKEW